VSAALKQHALSAAFPAMHAEDLSSLTDDIAVNGLRQRIVLFEGQVLDGWHRLSACGAAGVPPEFVEFEGDDPVAFVTSLGATFPAASARQPSSRAESGSHRGPISSREGPHRVRMLRQPRSSPSRLTSRRAPSSTRRRPSVAARASSCATER
jgi:hypothetical protein